MRFDIFLSICHTPVDGYIPTEAKMFENFFDQVELADRLGFGTAWVAEAHLSCQVQKQNTNPVIPHFQGEIGLNTDVLQLAHCVFARTQRIHVGSAIRNIVCNGGPIAHAEAVKTFLSLHAATCGPERRLELGFAAGRFPFSNNAYGIRPRNELERRAWPALRGKVFQQAAEIFLRFLRGDVLSSDDVAPMVLERASFRSDDDWESVLEAHGGSVDRIDIPTFWDFEKVGVIPKDPPLNSLRLTIGSHDPKTQIMVNRILPCGVFNLSFTPPEKIEATHDRMAEHYHPDGGPWRRWYMPRTALVFLDASPGLSSEQQTDRAREVAIRANENYWKAMQGTIDPGRIRHAVNNALVGSPEEVIRQIRERYHPDDRLMMWFDFHNHDNQSVKDSMRLFMERVAPALRD